MKSLPDVASPPVFTGAAADRPEDTTDFRANLALREFVLGNLTLPAASQVAGRTEDDFIALLARSDLSTFRPPDDSVSSPGEERIPPRVSVIVPLHNEEENLQPLHARLSTVLAPLGRYEIVFVDDGSRDRSVQIVFDLQRQDPAVKLVRLTRNFGKEAALAAGMDTARGEAVIVMDADLQDPPEVLPDLVRQWELGFEVVYAVRRKRKESLWKRAGYHMFYRVMRLVADVEMPLDAGDFCLMDRRVVDVVRRLPEKNRFMRGLRSWAGFDQTGVEYERPVRYAGDTKFTLRKLVKTAVEGLMAFTSAPLRLAAYVGCLAAAAGMLFLGAAVYDRFAGHTPDGWTSLVSIALLLGGTQLIVTGVLGAYIARIYEETKRRPMYVIEGTYDHTRARRG